MHAVHASLPSWHGPGTLLESKILGGPSEENKRKEARFDDNNGYITHEMNGNNICIL